MKRGAAIEFSFIVSDNKKNDIQTRVVNVGNRHLYDGEDIVFFHIHLLDKEAEPNHVRIGYKNWHIMTLPIIINGEKISIGNRTFMIDATHQLELNEDGHVKTIFITLENNKLTFDDHDPAQYIEPRVELPIDGLRQLTWIAFHPDDEILEDVSLQVIPQRTPTWFRIKSDYTSQISGTTVGKLAAGYWLDEEKPWEKPVHQIIKDRIRKENNFRYGRIREDETMIIAIHNFPEWTFEECGYFTFILSELPDRVCGCSPDGLAKRNDEIMVMEYKASYYSTEFPDYYIPQLYWEMIATRASTATLIRYKRKRQQTKDGRWKTLREAMAYTIQRDLNVEQLIIQSLITPNHQACQKACKDIVSKTKGIRMNIPEQLIDQHEQKKRDVIKKVLV